MERALMLPVLIVAGVIAVVAVIGGQQQELEGRQKRLAKTEAHLVRERERLRQAEIERRRTAARHRAKSRKLEQRTEAEKVRRGWSDAYALAATGVIVVALVLIGSLLRMRATLMRLVRQLAHSWRSGGPY